MSSDDSNSKLTFPHLYRQWVGHDLKLTEDFDSIRPWFYEGLRPEDEPQVWHYIEKNYLLKYANLVAVRFDWSSSGLWGIPFPGSVMYGGNICLERWGVPERVKNLLRAWHDPLDARLIGEEDNDFDHAASDVRGLAAAETVKLFLGERTYVEFHPFQEKVITGRGRAEETRVPESILEFSSGG